MIQLDPENYSLTKKKLAEIFKSLNKKVKPAYHQKLFWKNNLVKCEIALATGKQGKDKRQTIKARDWIVKKREN